jgi:hypothetical protein
MGIEKCSGVLRCGLLWTGTNMEYVETQVGYVLRTTESKQPTKTRKERRGAIGTQDFSNNPETRKNAIQRGEIEDDDTGRRKCPSSW